MPELRPLATDIDSLLATVDTTLTTVPEDRPPAPPLPDLRAGYNTFAEGCTHAGDNASLLPELDEIVDAANGLAELAGLDPLGIGEPTAD